MELNVAFCSVCGDTATCYRLYGAKMVCYSCRIFFRRTVKANKSMKCIQNVKEPCSFNKLTRNRCRSCRFTKCLQEGMNPLLVDSCKQTKLNEEKFKTDKKKNQSNTSSSNEVSLSFQQVMSQPPQPHSLSMNSLDSLAKQLETVFDNILMNPEGEYMKRLFEVDKSMIEQVRSKNKKISVPHFYISSFKSVLESIGVQFLRKFFPQFSVQSLELIASSVSKTLIGLMAGIDKCFQDTHRNMLDQLKCYFPCSQAYLQFWQEAEPDLISLEAIHQERYDISTSPWATNIDDEYFVDSTNEKLSIFLQKDYEIGKLLFLLASFSPINVRISHDKMTSIKQYQSMISMMLYTHILSKDETDNASALERLGKVGGILEDLNRCGEIFHEGVIYVHDDIENVHDIEAIDVDLL